MSRAVVVVNCSHVVTLRGPDRLRVGSEMSELGLVSDGALLAVDGLVQGVGSWEEIRADVPSDAVHIDAGRRIVLPGFVDAHTHLVFGGNRVEEFELRSSGASYEEIAASGGGILSTVRKTRGASVDELVTVGRRHLDWMLRGGTTTVEAKSGYGLTVDDELKILLAQKRLNEEGPVEIVSTALAAHAVSEEFGKDAASYVREVAIPILRRAKDEGMAEFADAFVERNYFDQESLAPYFEEAKSLGFGLRLHVDQLTDSGGAALAAKWGAKTADHLEQTRDQGIEGLKHARVIPVLLPGSVFGLGREKYPDARAMVDRGLPVVLATDFNPGSSPVSSMGTIMSLACRYMKMSPAEALTACTVNAAQSLNRLDRGSLEPGKRADFVIHDADDFREIPYWLGPETAWKVLVAGSEVL